MAVRVGRVTAISTFTTLALAARDASPNAPRNAPLRTRGHTPSLRTAPQHPHAANPASRPQGASRPQMYRRRRSDPCTSPGRFYSAATTPITRCKPLLTSNSPFCLLPRVAPNVQDQWQKRQNCTTATPFDMHRPASHLGDQFLRRKLCAPKKRFGRVAGYSTEQIKSLIGERVQMRTESSERHAGPSIKMYQV